MVWCLLGWVVVDESYITGECPFALAVSETGSFTARKQSKTKGILQSSFWLCSEVEIVITSVGNLTPTVVNFRICWTGTESSAHVTFCPSASPQQLLHDLSAIATLSCVVRCNGYSTKCILSPPVQNSSGSSSSGSKRKRGNDGGGVYRPLTRHLARRISATR
jgi:hypothetical protein